MNQIRKLTAGAFAAAVLALSPTVSSAATVQLGFILDESGSIAASEWQILRSGLASAINLIPVAGPDSYYLSIVTFDGDANQRLDNTLVTAANRAGLAAAVLGYVQGAGATNYEAAFKGMDAALGNSNLYDFSYVNFATDGDPNTCGYPSATGTPGLAGSQACAIVGKTQLTASGVDNISVEGIGVSASATTFLKTSICYPQPCDDTAPFNFPTEGFYIAVANATEYSTALQNKVRVVTNQTPEPGSVALVGLALAAAGLARRRKVA